MFVKRSGGHNGTNLPDNQKGSIRESEIFKVVTFI